MYHQKRAIFLPAGMSPLLDQAEEEEEDEAPSAAADLEGVEMTAVSSAPAPAAASPEAAAAPEARLSLPRASTAPTPMRASTSRKNSIGRESVSEREATPSRASTRLSRYSARGTEPVTGLDAFRERMSRFVDDALDAAVAANDGHARSSKVERRSERWSQSYRL